MEYLYIVTQAPVIDSETSSQIALEKFTILESLNRRKDFNLFGDPKCPASHIYFRVKETGQEVYLTYDWAVIENTPESLAAYEIFKSKDIEFHIVEKQREALRQKLHFYKS